MKIFIVIMVGFNALVVLLIGLHMFKQWKSWDKDEKMRMAFVLVLFLMILYYGSHVLNEYQCVLN